MESLKIQILSYTQCSTFALNVNQKNLYILKSPIINMNYGNKIFDI